MRLLGMLGLLRRAYRSWSEDKAQRLGAALAYYTVFSVPPLLILLIGVAGIVFGRDAVQARILGTLQELVGEKGAGIFRAMIESTGTTGRGLLATTIGLVTLVLGASGVFGQLKDALNTVWEVEPKPGNGLRMFLKKYFFSLTLLAGTGFLLVVSLALNAALAALGQYLASVLPGGAVLWGVVNQLFSLAVLTVLFALMFRYIPDAHIRWKDVLVGGLVTAVLFTIGEALIGLYLGRTNVGSAFGAAGSLVVLLVWIYYSAQIFLFGAEYTKVYAVKYGPRIVPEDGAQPVSDHGRAQQGIPRPAHG